MDTITTPYVIPLSTQKPKSLTLVPSDPGSRYKTRQLQVQIVGKSKMIKTVLLNILDVAKDCQVPPSYIGTFMGYVIGAQAKFDLKKPERQQAFLSGEHDPKDLSKIFHSFIVEVLLCPTCGLPEILIAPEQKSVYGTCRACGSHAELKIQDEKFKRYVINHPPVQSKGAFAGNKAGTKKDTSKKEDKDEKKEGDKEKEVVVEKPKKTKIKDEDIVWFSDTSDEAARKRREEMLPDTILVDSVKKLDVNDDTQQLFKDAVKDGADALLSLKTKKNMDDKSFITACFDAIVAQDADLLAEVKSKSPLLVKLVKNSTSQLTLLECIENFCGKVNVSQLSKVPLILKELYDKEIFDEENIFKWNDNKSSDSVQSVRDQAAPMIKWLKEAEEEGSDDDEEEDDE